MILFYTVEITHPFTELSEEEAHHGIRVLRLKEGQEVGITDGKGQIFSGRFIPYTGKHARVEIHEIPAIEKKRTHRVVMAVAPLKSNDRFEWFLEKATELGVAEIIPILCEHGERSKYNKERWQRVMLAAVKQSLNPWLPVLHEPLKFSDFIKSNGRKTFLAHCAPGEKKNLSEVLGNESQICICIGPEGDFSSSEIKESLQNGYVPVSLGELRLRTETAALVASVLAVNGGMG